MDPGLLFACLLIVVARVADVSLGTLRTVYIVQGRKGVAFLLGFVEVLIWLIVVARVIQNVQQPAYAVSYALGFGLGTYVGILLEDWFRMGEQVVRIFSRRGEAMAEALREAGFVVTRFEGKGREGPISLLFLQVPRRRVRDVVRPALRIDPECFYIVDDVRMTSGYRRRSARPGLWPGAAKRK